MEQRVITRVFDQLEAGGIVRTRWCAEEEFDDPPFDCATLRSGTYRIWSDAVLDLHYCELVQPYRGPVEIHFKNFEKKFIRVLAWSLVDSRNSAVGGKQRVSEAMSEGAASYASMTGRWPKWAFMQVIPKGAEIGVEVDGVCLIQADWAVPGFIFIGG